MLFYDLRYDFYIDVICDIANSTVKDLKFQTLFSFCFCKNDGYQPLSGLKLTKCLLEKQTGKTLIRLLPRKQSDLGLPCLFMLLQKATTVLNFRTFTVVMIHLSYKCSGAVGTVMVILDCTVIISNTSHSVLEKNDGYQG